tara:strand:+ start:242 stop:439 length:198 start_codon:yes stop_codon:yes gene_type:complete
MTKENRFEKSKELYGTERVLITVARLMETLADRLDAQTLALRDINVTLEKIDQNIKFLDTNFLRD